MEVSQGRDQPNHIPTDYALTNYAEAICLTLRIFHVFLLAHYLSQQQKKVHNRYKGGVANS